MFPWLKIPSLNTHFALAEFWLYFFKLLNHFLPRRQLPKNCPTRFLFKAVLDGPGIARKSNRLVVLAALDCN